MVSVPAHRGQEAFATARRAAGDISPDVGTCLSPTMTNEVIIRPIQTPTPQGGPGRVLTVRASARLAQAARPMPEWEKRTVKIIGLSGATSGSHIGWRQNIEETQG